MADAPVPRTPVAARAKPADEPMSSAKKLLSSVRMKQMAGVNLPHLRTVTIPTRAVLAQYKEIQHSMPSGMFVIPDETRFRVWHGVLFVPPGVTFAHHVITFTLTIADNFPAEGAAPTIVFQQWPPHPLVQPGVSGIGIHASSCPDSPRLAFVAAHSPRPVLRCRGRAWLARRH